jgi:hypothetical protein
MTLDTESIIADAIAGIAEAGFSVIFTQKVLQPDSPNSSAPTRTQDYPATVVSTKTSRAFMQNGQEINVAKTLLIGATGFVPRQGDKVTISGYPNPFGVVRVQQTDPSGVALLFKVDLAT